MKKIHTFASVRKRESDTAEMMQIAEAMTEVQIQGSTEKSVQRCQTESVTFKSRGVRSKGRLYIQTSIL